MYTLYAQSHGPVLLKNVPLISINNYNTIRNILVSFFLVTVYN